MYPLLLVVGLACLGADPAAATVELDLGPLGPDFKGHVARVPAGAKIENKRIIVGPGAVVSFYPTTSWDTTVAELKDDKANKNFQMISPTEVHFERTPPLGTAWTASVLVKVGAALYECTNGSGGGPGTFVSAAKRNELAAVCKSIRRK